MSYTVNKYAGKKRQPNIGPRKAAAMRLAPIALAVAVFCAAVIGVFLIVWGSLGWTIGGSCMIGGAWIGAGFGWEHAQALADKGNAAIR